MTRLRSIVTTTATATALAVAFWTYRRWHLRWGATPWEVRSVMAGDDLLTTAEFRPTRAITIRARPEEIWPWIVQIGYGKAGFYAYDLLDNLGRPSAEQVLPEFQTPRLDDWVAMAPNPNETTAFKVVGFEVDRWLLWSKPDSTWSWRLTPLDDERTRLVCRIQARYDWSRPLVLLTVPLMEFGDFPMSRRELLGIRRRAEAMAAARRAGPETVDAITDATHEAKRVMAASWPIGVPSRSTAAEAVDDTTYPRVAAALP